MSLFLEAEEEFKATATVAAVNTANRGAGSRGRGTPVGRGGAAGVASRANNTPTRPIFF